jgi:hypothetical protein
MEGAQDAQAVLAVGPPRLQLRLIRPRPRKFGWAKYVLVALVAAVAVCPASSEAMAALRAGLVTFTACALALYLGYKLRQAGGLVGAGLVEIGHVTADEEALTLRVDGQQSRFLLDASTLVELTYRGFKNEALTTRISATGIDNFIQINRGETYRFEVLTEPAQENLRVALRHWYQRKVAVKEHRQDGPTFLLHRNLSYEQIQAYKREFGVNLYG